MMDLYLVLDAKTNFSKLLNQVEQAVKGGIDLLQLVNAELYNNQELNEINQLCNSKKVKFILYNNIDLAIENHCAGVHLDIIPSDLKSVDLPDDFIVGVTVGNDFKVIEKYVNWGVDYISFCSLYPTSSAINCEIIDEKIIQQAIKEFDLKIYVAGGIKEHHLQIIKHWRIAGVAMISTLINAKNIEEKVKKIKKNLNS